MDTIVIVLLRAVKALTYAALKLTVGLSVGCGNDMSVISVSNKVKFTSMQRLHKEVLTTFCDRGPYNRIYRRIGM